MTQVCYCMPLNMILVPSHILLIVYFFLLYLLHAVSSLFLHLSIFIYLEKYYMVHAGYPNSLGYSAPHKGQRYHVPDWRRGATPSGEQETLNYFYSSIHNVVEHTFGVWKMKWRILLKMSSYPMSKQKMIVATTMYLHNFIHENHALDRHFHICDQDPNYMSTIPHRYATHAPLKMHLMTSLPRQMTYLWVGSMITLQLQYCSLDYMYQTFKCFWLVVW
jgi:hypothetical protein